MYSAWGIIVAAPMVKGVEAVITTIKWVSSVGSSNTWGLMYGFGGANKLRSRDAMGSERVSQVWPLSASGCLSA